MASLIGAFTSNRKLTLTTTSGGANISGSLSSFPVCVHIDSNSWTTAGDRTSFFGAHNSGGKRVQFFASDQTTNLAYEVDRYDSGNQVATYWVKVPTVTGNSTTDVYVAYGNDPNSADQDQKTSVWDSDFLAVYHLQAANGSGYFEDSTSNGYTLDNTSGHTEDTGAPINSGRAFTDDALYSGQEYAIAAGTPITISAWAKQNDDLLDHSSAAGVGKLSSNSTRRQLYWYTSSGGSTRYFNGEVNGTAKPSSVAAGTSWKHYAATYPGATRNTNDIKMYCDGADVGTTTSGTYSDFDGTNMNFSVGVGCYNSSAGTHKYRGNIDEVRFSKVQRSADWIKGEYWSMKKTSFPGDGWITWSAAGGGGGAASILRQMLAHHGG